MADNEKEAGAMTPSWQQAASTAATGDSNSHAISEETQETNVLERARRFLQDEEVKLSSREKKVEFLKSKGIEEADINALLKEIDEPTTPIAPTTTTKEEEKAEPSPTSKTTVVTTPDRAPGPEPEPEQATKPDHPPIITYPEFLTKPAKPPPLITASGLLNSLGIVAGLSTLVYGATRHLVGPMVETLTDARIDFHDNANKNLSRLVEKLEQSVSEVPASYHAVGKKTNNVKVVEYADSADDTGSSYDDPTELFHRDVGVQTSPPPTPDSSNNYHARGADGWPSSTSDDDNNNNNNKPGRNTPQQEADKLNNIISSVRGLSTALVSQAEDLAETKNVLDLFGQDLHALTYPPESFGAGNSYLYGSGRTEPDDEVRRVKNNIRSVKGVLLSTRSFPSVTR